MTRTNHTTVGRYPLSWPVGVPRTQHLQQLLPEDLKPAPEDAQE